MKTGCVTGTDLRASTETPSQAVTSGCDLTKTQVRGTISRFSLFRLQCYWKQ